MNKTKPRHHGGKKYVHKIAEEYRKLSTLSEPTEAELERILAIMELAEYDIELDYLINQEDKKYAEENNLLEDDCLYEESSSGKKLNNSTNLTVVENENDSDNVKYKNKGGTPKSKNAGNVILFPYSFKSHPKKKKKTFRF